MGERITFEVEGHVAKIGFDRADKYNAFDLVMLRELAEAYTRYEEDTELRCAIVFAHGKNFTAGLDLAEVGPAVAEGGALFPEGSVDPLGLYGRRRTKPVIMVAQGHCLTIGIELMLAADIRIAAEDTKFGQIEIERGIFPFGGATIRLPQIAGWGNAMRYLLTGDRFGAEEALRIGLVQEVAPVGEQLAVAERIAAKVASCAPLGVRETIVSSRTAVDVGTEEAAHQLLAQARMLMATNDAREGVQSFIERRAGKFTGS